MDEDDSLVRRRSRRSTAGNRMEAALAELGLADAEQEVEEDIDFMMGRDEEDVFESDFESTDEEAAEVVPEAGEKAVRDEERRTRKTVRSRVEKATAIAHARQKVTFNPEAYEIVSTPEKSTLPEKKKRRVSLGLAINAETGEVVTSAKRQSRRSHTMVNTKAAYTRMLDEEEKKSALPKRAKVKARVLSQNELIARALDMEEGNIAEHRNYLSIEEEKRKKAHAARMIVQGPLVRWVSKREEVDVPSESVGSSAAALKPPPAPSSYIAPNLTIQVPSEPAPMVKKTMIVCKNYVVHETSQDENATRPPWKDTMAAMFGDHVQWEDLKVYTTKNRPMARPVQTCPITGRPARYLDPRTNVPYANIAAFQTLSKILEHQYVWSPSLGRYVEPWTDLPHSD
ncbi:hypothetical protein EWM64_g6860 [Hericium alpestre]|uniref:Vps72/YL1 C-terminal domain-containing protein n=1 Tax=Hericium alpestre TaxID=135208 RepID=A0A4Y9ZRE3_9AGAM|nr:hypothetical protein EWM64_g6860 [Hericium alpestre]